MGSQNGVFGFQIRVTFASAWCPVVVMLGVKKGAFSVPKLKSHLLPRGVESAITFLFFSLSRVAPSLFFLFMVTRTTDRPYGILVSTAREPTPTWYECIMVPSTIHRPWYLPWYHPPSTAHGTRVPWYHPPSTARQLTSTNDQNHM